MGLALDYENEFQFQFQLEIVSSGETSQQIENAGVDTKRSHIRTYQNEKGAADSQELVPQIVRIPGRQGAAYQQLKARKPA
jgi:hypothetical protein